MFAVAPARSSTTRLCGAASALALALTLACSSSPAEAPAGSTELQADQGDLAGAPAWVRGGCEAYLEDAPGVCGVGSAEGSRNFALATTAAEGRGRTAIARTLQTRVQSMLKSYEGTTTGGEEFAEAAADEQHLVDVGRQITDGSMQGSERRELWISPSGAVYALMVLDLAKFQGAVWSMGQLSQSLRAHVARDAAAELAGVGAADPGEANVAERRPGGPVVLVTQRQLDAMPRDVAVAAQTVESDPDGPRIEIDSPKDDGVYEGPFPIKVAFRSGPRGFPVDMDSLALEYQVAWGIDITDKVREYVIGTEIDVAESELPEGRHTVEIRIEDTEGHQSRRLFTVTVK